MAENLMLMCGGNIRSNGDKLMKVTAQYLADKLKCPKPEVEMKVRQLRLMREIDEKGYKRCKTELPYIVNAIFNPPVRKTENFGYIESFIIDLDHLHEKGMGAVSLKNLVCQDKRVMLCFVSPSEDGLKLMFRLKDRIQDAGIFKVFYKEFAQKFALQYNISQVLDSVTCDVTRACFLSIDPDVYYNPEAEPVDYSCFVDTGNSQAMFDMLKAKPEKKDAKADAEAKAPKHDSDPDKEEMDKIRELLGVKKAKLEKPKRDWVVPEVLDELLPKIADCLKNSNIELVEARNIQYGKKLSCKLGLKMAEVNVYKGKGGFSVVATPKTGTSGDLNEIVKDLITLLIAES